MSSWYDYKPYVPVHERQANAKCKIAKLLGNDAQPIEKFGGRKLAKTFWGEAWCENLEAYSDYANRLPRGRTYSKNGSVAHLEINEGKVLAYISGSELYKVQVSIDALDNERWEAFKSRCSGRIDTLLDLLQGKVADAVLLEITNRQDGLFPAPKEIDFTCSCPDSAIMCKHVAATLYGVGIRLDSEPELFFALRGVDHAEIIASASTDSLDEGLPEHEDLLLEGDLAGIFGIEFSDIPTRLIKKMRAVKVKR
ncbi:MAG: putative Zn finger protein [Verrucomicrobiales bacterium]|jgi:uncharacterized Zn finger protein